MGAVRCCWGQIEISPLPHNSLISLNSILAEGGAGWYVSKPMQGR